MKICAVYFFFFAFTNNIVLSTPRVNIEPTTNTFTSPASLYHGGHKLFLYKQRKTNQDVKKRFYLILQCRGSRVKG